MSSHPTDESPHPEKLLPWYVNHTLSQDEEETVKAHLVSCTHCQQEVVLLEAMRDEIQKTSVLSPGEFGLKRFMKDIRQDKALQQKRRPSWINTALAIAASFIIIIQAGLLIEMWVQTPTLEPLAERNIGVVLQVAFLPTTTEAEIRDLLLEINGTFVGGPGQLGIYRIQLPFSDAPHISQIIQSIRQRTHLVTHVAKE